MGCVDEACASTTESSRGQLLEGSSSLTSSSSSSRSSYKDLSLSKSASASAAASEGREESKLSTPSISPVSSGQPAIAVAAEDVVRKDEEESGRPKECSSSSSSSSSSSHVAAPSCKDLSSSKSTSASAAPSEGREDSKLGSPSVSAVSSGEPAIVVAEEDVDRQDEDESGQPKGCSELSKDETTAKEVTINDSSSSLRAKLAYVPTPARGSRDSRKTAKKNAKQEVTVVVKDVETSSCQAESNKDEERCDFPAPRRKSGPQWSNFSLDAAEFHPQLPGVAALQDQSAHLHLACEYEEYCSQEAWCDLPPVLAATPNHCAGDGSIWSTNFGAHDHDENDPAAVDDQYVLAVWVDAPGGCSANPMKVIQDTGESACSAGHCDADISAPPMHLLYGGHSDPQAVLEGNWHAAQQLESQPFDPQLLGTWPTYEEGMEMGHEGFVVPCEPMTGQPMYWHAIRHGAFENIGPQGSYKKAGQSSRGCRGGVRRKKHAKPPVVEQP